MSLENQCARERLLGHLAERPTLTCPTGVDRHSSNWQEHPEMLGLQYTLDGFSHHHLPQGQDGTGEEHAS